ncbi:hypothetical protein [Bradyrhizobium sp. BRP56]|nr:hypothetical protein [Bradyrhizobium sp. BRP56]
MTPRFESELLTDILAVLPVHSRENPAGFLCVGPAASSLMR